MNKDPLPVLSNFFAVMGIASLRFLLGWLIERHPAMGGIYPPEAYRDALLLLFASMAAALILHSRKREITLLEQGSSD